MTNKTRFRTLAAAALLLTGGLAQAALINVDFEFDPDDAAATSSTTFSGQAGLTGDGNVWNSLNAAVGNIFFDDPNVGTFADIASPLTSGPLVDSTGAATGVSVTIDAAGIFAARNGYAGFANFATDAVDLMQEYLVAFEERTISIDGLTAGGMYDLALYGAGDFFFRDTTFSTGGGSQSTTADGGVHLLTLGTDYVVFEDVVADASGTILVSYGLGPENNEANFNGLQFQSVPEPGTLALLGLGVAGIGLSRRQRRKA